MAATFNVMAQGQRMGHTLINIVAVTLDSSYAAGGYAIAAADVGLDSLSHVVVQSACRQGYIIEWDGATASLIVRRTGLTNSVLSEVPAGTDLSGVVVDIFAIGPSN